MNWVRQNWVGEPMVERAIGQVVVIVIIVTTALVFIGAIAFRFS